MTSVMAVPETGTRSGPEPRRFRPDIQGLRAVAVLLVVLYHAGMPVLRGGFVGVDVFFVISGFLITRGLVSEVDRTGRVSLMHFYGRRMRRLLPAAALVIVVTLLLGRVVLPATRMSSLVHDAWFTAFYGINYHLAVEGVNYQNADVPPSALQHFWSLAVEEQFYLVWPLLLLVAAVVLRRRHRRVALVLGIGALSVTTFALSVVITPVNTPMGYFSLHTRAWELGLGAIVALSLPLLAKVPPRYAVPGTWIGLGLVLASALLYSDQTLYPGSAALLPVAGAALVIAAGTHRNPRTAESAILERFPMQYMGKVSYAWYLWHWPLLMLLPLWAGADVGVVGNLEIVVIAFWFAVLTYFVENASHRSSWSLHRWVPTGLGLSSAVAIGALALASTLPPLVGTGADQSVAALRTADVRTVQAALTSGAGLSALPHNLTPGLADAKNDIARSSADGCHASLLVTAVTPCTYGSATSTRTAVLVGDSHAQQWLGAILPDALANGWRVVTYTKAACPVARTPVWNNDLKRTYTECAQWQGPAFAAITAMHPDLIVASESDAVPWNSVTDAQWASLTVSSLEAMASPRTRVVYVGDTPQTEKDPVLCLQQHIDDISACSYTRSTAYAYFPARHGVLRAAATGAGFSYVDPLDWFCTQQACPTVVGNMLVRRDTGHVTNTYATWLAPMFSPLFEDVTS